MAEPVSTLAAQAMRDFSQEIKSGKLKPGYWLTQTTWCLEALRNAVHFSVSQTCLWGSVKEWYTLLAGRVARQVTRSYREEEVIYAPYKSFTVEIVASFEGDRTSLLVCSAGKDKGPSGKDCLYVWHIYAPQHGSNAKISNVWSVNCGPEDWIQAYAPPEVLDRALSNPPKSKKYSVEYRDSCYYGQMILSRFLQLLKTTHTEEVIQQASPKNNRRILDGKLPIWEVKTLVLKTPVTRTVSEYKGGTHASPRQHTRRGHYRHYKSGKIAWVRDCIVGSLEKGFVHKDYRVEPAAA